MPRSAQFRIANRLQRLVKDARSAGIVLIADADDLCVRVATREEYDANASDIRRIGITVDLPAACGGPVLPRIDKNGNG